MPNLEIHYPFKHFIVTNGWNVPWAGYEKFGFKSHNGIDAISSYNDQYTAYNPTKWPIYCPVENFSVHMMRNSPEGGGKEVWLLSNEPLQIGNTVCHAYMGFAHNDHIFMKVGDKPALGEIIAIADNTGATSTGAHSHMGLYRVAWDGKIMTFLDKNDANGSYDPSLFFTEDYAVDKASASTLIKSALRYAQWYLGA